MPLALALTAWSAWAPDKTTPQAWLAWARNEPVADEALAPDISAIPAIQRRRVSNLSRMAFGSAVACSGTEAAEVSCIFASRHGELTRTLGILDSIVTGEDVSPTDFSHSVHNTALGLFSIFMKNKAASTQVVAAEDTFGAALIEASIHLSRFPDRDALVVFFDEPLPPPLDSLDTGPHESFSMALLFSAKGAPNIALDFSHHQAVENPTTNSGLDFLRFHLSGAASGSSATRRTTWRWSRL